MKRADQLEWLRATFTVMFWENSKTVLQIVDLCFKSAIDNELFSIDQDELTIRESLSRVEYLRNTIGFYIRKNPLDANTSEDIYLWIWLIYESCLRELSNIINRYDQDTETKEKLKESMLTNLFLTVVYYGWATWQKGLPTQTWMAQIIANKYYSQVKDILSNDIAWALVKFLYISNNETKLFEKKLNANFDEFIDANYKLISFQINKCINNFWLVLMSNYAVTTQYEKYIRAFFLNNKSSFLNRRFLLPWQLKVLNEINDEENNIISLPTWWWKSLVAEIQILKTLYSTEKKVIYIAPTVSLCAQIKEDLINRFNTSISENIYASIIFWIEYDDLGIDIDASNLVTVMTPEKFLILISRWLIDLNDIWLVVIDEFHSIWSEDSRSTTMQIIINLLKLHSTWKETKLLLISALASNHQEVAYWINWFSSSSDLTTVRKVLIVWSWNNEWKIKVYKDHSKELMSEYDYGESIWLWSTARKRWFTNLKAKDKVIVFSWKKSEVKKSKLQESTNFFWVAETIQKDDPLYQYARICECSPLELKAINYWVWFSYWWMNTLLHSLIIRYYKDNLLKVMVCNSTLMAWMNLDCKYLYVSNINFGLWKHSKSDLLNLFWRVWRFPLQSDGFIFMHNILAQKKGWIVSTKWTMDSSIEELTDNSIWNIVSWKEKYDESFISDFEIYLFNRLIIKWKDVNAIIKLTDDEKVEIIESFISSLDKFFVNKDRSKKVIDKLVEHFTLRDNYNNIFWAIADSRYLYTGMKRPDSKVLIEIYEKLKLYRQNDYISSNIESIEEFLPSEIINNFKWISAIDEYNLSKMNLKTEKKQIEFSFSYEWITHSYQLSNYWIPRIIGCLIFFWDNEELFDTDPKYKEIRNRLKYISYKFKYWCKTYWGYKIFDRYRVKGMPVDIAEFLSSKWLTENDYWKYSQVLKEDELYWPIIDILNLDKIPIDNSFM